jgi:hypothetical protein
MLACAPSAWDMYFVYPADFIRELKEIMTNGIQAVVLEVKPFGGLSGVGEHVGDFNWQPDGKYITFVRCAVIVYIVHTVVHSNKQLPAWLLLDLVSVAGSCTPRGNNTERCIAGLKSSILASKLNRNCDPLLLDHMLTQCGFGTEKTSGQFIARYNQQVFYDDSLMLKDSAAKRQARFLE